MTDTQHVGRVGRFARRRGVRRMTSAATIVAFLALVVLAGELVGSERGLPGGPAGAPVPERVPDADPTSTSSTNSTSSTSSTTAPASSTVELDPLDIEIRSVETRSPGGALEQLGEQARKRITTTIAGYVTEASLRPLQVRDGAVREQRLRSLFTQPIRSRLAGPDRATLVDEGMDRAVGGVDVERAAVELSVLGDAEGRPRLVTATLDLAVVAHSADGPLLVTRTGDLVLSPDEQRWLIDGYRLSVTRDLGADAAARAGV